jgi:alcohol dehydrogenase
VLIVTDKDLPATLVDPIAQQLADARLAVSIFRGVQPNPTIANIAAGAEAANRLAQDVGPSCVLGVGGGSSLDAATVTALAANNLERGLDLELGLEFDQPAMPWVAVPTTSGTGSHLNDFGVITAGNRKFYAGHPSCLARGAILDPLLTKSLPPRATAETGWDVLTHAVESRMSSDPYPGSEALALKAIRIVMTYLPRAVKVGEDLEARTQMMHASHYAAIAMGPTGLGACHAIGHALGGQFDIAHGASLMTLPAVLRFSFTARVHVLSEIAYACGVWKPNLSTTGNARAAIAAIQELSDTLGITRPLSDFGITQADIPGLAVAAVDDPVVIHAPVRPTPGDVSAILGEYLSA